MTLNRVESDALNLDRIEVEVFAQEPQTARALRSNQRHQPT